MPVAVEIPEKRVPSSSNKKLISISFDDSFLQRISVSDEEDGKSAEKEGLLSSTPASAMKSKPRAVSFSYFEKLALTKLPDQVISSEGVIIGEHETALQTAADEREQGKEEEATATAVKQSRWKSFKSFFCACFSMRVEESAFMEKQEERQVEKQVDKSFIPQANVIASAPLNESAPDIPLPKEIIQHAPTISLLPRAEDPSKPLLVLDLDETLVHSSFEKSQADLILPINLGGYMHNVYVGIRPHMKEFLKRVGLLYEVAIFTASLSNYADPVIDAIDEEKVVKHRLFRESCINYRGAFIKDLSLLGRPLQNTIIIDNMPSSYAFHPNNAIPILSWFSNPNDCELLKLLVILEEIHSSDNIVDALEIHRQNGVFE